MNYKDLDEATKQALLTWVIYYGDSPVKVTMEIRTGRVLCNDQEQDVLIKTLHENSKYGLIDYIAERDDDVPNEVAAKDLSKLNVQIGHLQLSDKGKEVFKAIQQGETGE